MTIPTMKVDEQTFGLFMANNVNCYIEEEDPDTGDLLISFPDEDEKIHAETLASL